MWILDVNTKLGVNILIHVTWYLMAYGIALRIREEYMHPL